MSKPTLTSKSDDTESKRHRCGDCSYTTNVLHNLLAHIRTHTGEKPFVCGIDGCTVAFATKVNLDTHKRVHTGEKPFSCGFDGCYATFTQKSNMISHQRTHTGDKRFKCTFDGCTAKFCLKVALDRHERIHTGIKPYACEFENCGAKFAQKSNLDNHIRVHTGQKPYHCTFDGCNANFANQSNLISHLRYHTDDKVFVCDFESCSEAFTRKLELVRHKKIHTGGKPHVCDFEGCIAAFTAPKDLVRHKRIHSGEKPFRCDICPSAFARKGNLTTHKRVHGGEYFAACTECGALKRTKQDLTDHIESRHNGNVKQYTRVEEQRIYDLLVKHNLPFDDNNHIDFCSDSTEKKKRAYLDFVIYKETWIGVLEVDEHSHRPKQLINNVDEATGQENCPQYAVSCEQSRMLNIVAGIRTTEDVRPIVFFRYNPHTFYVDGVKQDQLTAEVREQTLIKVLQEYEPVQDLEIQYMFYDTYNDPSGILRCKLWDHKDYSPEMLKCTRTPIIG